MTLEERAKAFLEAVAALSMAYNVSLAHEDSQGAFIVEPYDEGNVEWLMNADIKEDG